MRRYSLLLVTALVISIATTGIASADDLLPPVWRGQPGTTFQMWEFETPAPVTNPEPGWFNPNGMASALAVPGTGQNWEPIYAGRTGVWPLSGMMEVTIPNYNIPNPTKLIWVQLTWAKQVTSSIPILSEARFPGETVSLIQQLQLDPIWFHSTYLIELDHNPDWEIVRIDGTIMVDELVIDTWCVPEPGSLMALAVGLVGMAGIIRKKK